MYFLLMRDNMYYYNITLGSGIFMKCGADVPAEFPRWPALLGAGQTG